ncbi:MAG: MBL fold metallo-hydrolase [Cytophagales bacterium]|nr:MBL fold metallo-hydrolase [Cytophagales bacterium]
MIQIAEFTFNAFQENTYVLFDETKECVIIDPGCYEEFERIELQDFIESNGLKVVKLLNTHSHVDHILGNFFVKNKYDVKLFIHKKDEETLRSVKLYAPTYGFELYQEVKCDEYLEEGDVVTFGNSSLNVLFVPGHAPGHIVFVNKEQKFCINGDVLFRRSIGRTDLPGGDHETLITNIREKMFALPEDMVVYAGHGPSTTIGEEKRENPFLR